MDTELRAGCRVCVWGGYEPAPQWLAGGVGYLGAFVEFVPSRRGGRAAVVQLDRAITVGGATGQLIVLELRYPGTAWCSGETVSVELCDVRLEDAVGHCRVAVESHATVEILD
jgi:hypothetical protein